MMQQYSSALLKIPSMSRLYGAHLEELKLISKNQLFMTSTSLKKILYLCRDRAEQMSKSSEQYAHAMALVYENIAHLCEIEMPNEKQMIIDICNECAKDMMSGNLAVGKSAGEQLYKKKYA
jgi:hypothetical protein